jgi:enoyl-CoA hydratase
MTTDERAAYCEVEGGLAHIYLNRPRQLNAFNVAMRDALWEILRSLHEDATVSAVLISGNGDRGFCSGADLTEFGTAPSRAIARGARYLRDVWGLLRSLSVPTVAALHGYTIGSGLEMALCCDLRIASEETRFRLPEVALGMIPFATGSQGLPRTIGRAAALDLLLTGRWFEATEALRLGIVQHVVPPDQLVSAAEALVAEARRVPRGALMRAKSSLRVAMDQPIAGGLETERRSAAINLTEAVAR